MLSILRRKGIFTAHRQVVAFSSPRRVDRIDLERESANLVFRELENGEKYFNIVQSHWIDKKTWQSYINNMRRKYFREPLATLGTQAMLDKFVLKLKAVEVAMEEDNSKVNARINEANSFLFNLMLPKAKVDLKEVVDAYKALNSTTDMRLPHEWYPVTRLMKRNIIYHGGPTNSGKVSMRLFCWIICDGNSINCTICITCFVDLSSFETIGSS